MEKIKTIEGLEPDDVEELLRATASRYLQGLNLPEFSSEGLKPVRSDKELQKCAEILEKEKKTVESKKLDIEAKKTQKSGSRKKKLPIKRKEKQRGVKIFK